MCPSRGHRFEARARGRAWPRSTPISWRSQGSLCTCASSCILLSLKDQSSEESNGARTVTWRPCGWGGRMCRPDCGVDTSYKDGQAQPYRTRSVIHESISIRGHQAHEINRFGPSRCFLRCSQSRKMVDSRDNARLTLRAEQESHARRRAGDMFARLIEDRISRRAERVVARAGAG